MKGMGILSFVLFAAIVSLCVEATFFCSVEDTLHRRVDGKCNNILHPDWAAHGSFFKPMSEGREKYPWVDVPQVPAPLPTYANASTLPGSGPRGNARNISNKLCIRANASEVDPINHSIFSVIFAQFINHDLEANRLNGPMERVFPLVTYLIDPTDPTCAAVQGPPSPFRCNPTDPMLTSEARTSTGVYDSEGNGLFYNDATGYLDLGTVYGTSEEITDKLRTFSGGKLLMTPVNSVTVGPTGQPAKTYTFYDTLPTVGETGLEINQPLTALAGNLVYTAGDSRVNENVALSMMHTIWAREHNHIADELVASNPLWASDLVRFDDAIFKKAKAITIAKYQHIVYEQYFPTEFGEYWTQKLGEYSFYKSYVDATTSKVFASAAFRYGHFIIKNWWAVDECGQSYSWNKTGPTAPQVVSLGVSAAQPATFAPLAILAQVGSFENVARGIIDARSSPVSLRTDEKIRNLRIPPGVVDLITLDITRARHHQVPNYQTIRRHWYGGSALENRIYGLPGCPISLQNQADVTDPLECFTVITGETVEAAKLRNLYKKVNLIDALIGLGAEKHVENTGIPRTLGNIIVDQYKRSRDGDRFFYKNLIRSGYFSYSERQAILSTTAATILRRNLDSSKLVVPENPFRTPEGYRTQLAATCAAH